MPGTPGTSIDWQRIDDTTSRAHCSCPSTTATRAQGNFRLFLVRRPANDQAHKIGTLLVNPGGPGRRRQRFA